MIQDQDLIAKCIKHDLKAQRELYNRYAPKLMPMALRYAKSHQDGEDILQESFIKIFKNLKSFRGDAQFLTWMKRIVINTAINHNRGKLKKESMLAIEDVTLYVEKDMILSDFHFTELLAMIQRLPTGCRTIFNLFALEGFGHREIAEQLGISEGTSKSQYARARALLMSMVEKANRVFKFKYFRMKNEFEKNIQNIFEDVELTPSENVWNGVEESLKDGRKKIFGLKWAHFTIAASIITVLGLGYLFSERQPGSTSKELNPKQFTEKPIPSVVDSISGGKEVAKKDKNDPIAQPQSVNPIKDLIFDNQDIKAIDLVSIEDKNNNELADRIQNTGFVAEQKNGLPGNIEPSPLPLIQNGRSVVDILRWRNKYLVPSPGFNREKPKFSEKELNGIAFTGSLSGGSFNPNPGNMNAQSDQSLEATRSTFTDQELSKLALGGIIAQLDDGSVGRISNSQNIRENSFSIGTGLSFDLSERWGLRTGLNFSQLRFSSTSNAFSEEDGKDLPIFISTGFNPESVFLVERYSLTNIIASVSVPVNISYKFLKRNNYNLALSVGIGLDYMISYRIKGDLNILETRKVDLSDNTGLNRVNLNGLTSLEFNYKLNNQFGLTAETFYKRNLTQSNGVLDHPSFYGFGLSVNYFLKPR